MDILNKIYQGEAQPGDDMKMLFHGYSHSDLQDQIETTKQGLNVLNLTIDDYVIVKTKENAGGLLVTVKMNATIQNKSSGHTEKRTREEQIQIALIDGSYKRTRW